MEPQEQMAGPSDLSVSGVPTGSPQGGGGSGRARDFLRRQAAALHSRDYYRTLQRLQEVVRPATYLEIGVRKGDSLALATTASVAIGVDPAPIPSGPVAANAKIFATTSDDFFAACDLDAELGGRGLDLAFIDGMHLFEFVLRDLANVERRSTPATVVVLHDCLPVDARSAERDRSTSLWTGDVWKVVPVLLRHRPDLRLTVLDAPPSGLVIVEGLDASSRVLDENAASIVAEYTPMGFDAFERHRRDVEALIGEPEAVFERLAKLAAARAR
jgi:hypothetical protein